MLVAVRLWIPDPTGLGPSPSGPFLFWRGSQRLMPGSTLAAERFGRAHVQAVH
jgi:hypothetical protein